MNQKAFSLIEVLITCGVLALLVGSAVVTYNDYSETSWETTTLQDLDTLRKVIEASEAQRGVSVKGGPLEEAGNLSFGGNTKDYWGSPYQIDVQQSMVYSFGPDQTDNHGRGDDITLSYSSITGGFHLDPPQNPVASGKSGAIKISWQLPVRKKGLTGFRIEKRKDKTTQWIPCHTIKESPEDHLSWTDASETKAMIYYRVIALYHGSKESKPSSLAGWVPVY